AQMEKMRRGKDMPVETDYPVIRAGNLRTDSRTSGLILETGSAIYQRIKLRSSRTDVQAEPGSNPSARIPKPKQSFNIPL
ncbi:MAG: hypothetical protein UT63_C0053G0019, partial [Candidatus Gottesmanbacteria bacterium GW2011_GWC2_39_8]